MLPRPTANATFYLHFTTLRTAGLRTALGVGSTAINKGVPADASGPAVTQSPLRPLLYRALPSLKGAAVVP